ncbi:hypothetical protein AX774_g7355 [Zancudomyces culisetae]|uniref:Uncharacterized protein n=1 Tax=Zancudomyces culisetae TaxID=1213189 RepID=A0A1R1PEE2_ZANCU|nr:hypothetical protein AX774_g7355 [Zancudomyces culisetae]|eukprot:OMH79242.1 hypothetical protein AX774_g7355 [Zancudomyces culisetae]
MKNFFNRQTTNINDCVDHATETENNTQTKYLYFEIGDSNTNPENNDPSVQENCLECYYPNLYIGSLVMINSLTPIRFQSCMDCKLSTSNMADNSYGDYPKPFIGSSSDLYYKVSLDDQVYFVSCIFETKSCVTSYLGPYVPALNLKDLQDTNSANVNENQQTLVTSNLNPDQSIIGNKIDNRIDILENSGLVKEYSGKITCVLQKKLGIFTVDNKFVVISPTLTQNIIRKGVKNQLSAQFKAPLLHYNTTFPPEVGSRVTLYNYHICRFACTNRDRDHARKCGCSYGLFGDKRAPGCVLWGWKSILLDYNAIQKYNGQLVFLCSCSLKSSVYIEPRNDNHHNKGSTKDHNTCDRIMDFTTSLSKLQNANDGNNSRIFDDVELVSYLENNMSSSLEILEFVEVYSIISKKFSVPFLFSSNDRSRPGWERVLSNNCISVLSNQQQDAFTSKSLSCTGVINLQGHINSDTQCMESFVTHNRIEPNENIGAVTTLGYVKYKMTTFGITVSNILNRDYIYNLNRNTNTNSGINLPAGCNSLRYTEFENKISFHTSKFLESELNLIFNKDELGLYNKTLCGLLKRTTRKNGFMKRKERIQFYYLSDATAKLLVLVLEDDLQHKSNSSHSNSHLDSQSSFSFSSPYYYLAQPKEDGLELKNNTSNSNDNNNSNEFNSETIGDRFHGNAFMWSNYNIAYFHKSKFNKFFKQNERGTSNTHTNDTSGGFNSLQCCIVVNASDARLVYNLGLINRFRDTSIFEHRDKGHLGYFIIPSQKRNRSKITGKNNRNKTQNKQINHNEQAQAQAQSQSQSQAQAQNYVLAFVFLIQPDDNFQNYLGHNVFKYKKIGYYKKVLINNLTYAKSGRYLGYIKKCAETAQTKNTAVSSSKQRNVNIIKEFGLIPVSAICRDPDQANNTVFANQLIIRNDTIVEFNPEHYELQEKLFRMSVSPAKEYRRPRIDFYDVLYYFSNSDSQKISVSGKSKTKPGMTKSIQPNSVINITGIVGSVEMVVSRFTNNDQSSFQSNKPNSFKETDNTDNQVPHSLKLVLLSHFGDHTRTFIYLTLSDFTFHVVKFIFKNFKIKVSNLRVLFSSSSNHYYCVPTGATVFTILEDFSISQSTVSTPNEHMNPHQQLYPNPSYKSPNDMRAITCAPSDSYPKPTSFTTVDGFEISDRLIDTAIQLDRVVEFHLSIICKHCKHLVSLNCFVHCFSNLDGSVASYTNDNNNSTSDRLSTIDTLFEKAIHNQHNQSKDKNATNDQSQLLYSNFILKPLLVCTVRNTIMTTTIDNNTYFAHSNSNSYSNSQPRQQDESTKSVIDLKTHFYGCYKIETSNTPFISTLLSFDYTIWKSLSVDMVYHGINKYIYTHNAFNYISNIHYHYFNTPINSPSTSSKDGKLYFSNGSSSSNDNTGGRDPVSHITGCCFQEYNSFNQQFTKSYCCATPTTHSSIPNSIQITNQRIFALFSRFIELLLKRPVLYQSRFICSAQLPPYVSDLLSRCVSYQDLLALPTITIELFTIRPVTCRELFLHYMNN